MNPPADAYTMQSPFGRIRRRYRGTLAKHPRLFVYLEESLP